MDESHSFTFSTIADSDDTDPPETFFINVVAIRTASILTPRIEVTICGGMCICLLVCLSVSLSVCLFNYPSVFNNHTLEKKWIYRSELDTVMCAINIPFHASTILQSTSMHTFNIIILLCSLIHFMCLNSVTQFQQLIILLSHKANLPWYTFRGKSTNTNMVSVLL